MERTIGKYSKLIKSKVLAGKNAGNLVERLAIRGYVNLALNTNILLETITPNKTSLDDFLELPPTATQNYQHQLWSPFSTNSLTSSDSLIESVPINHIIQQLKIYYSRATSSPLSTITIKNTTIKIAARALLYNHVLSSEMYRRIRSERRRGNHFVLFHAFYKS